MKKSLYWAKVKLSDTQTYQVDWEKEGYAEEVIPAAIEFISKKDSDDIYKRLIDYISRDFKSFDKLMSEAFFGKKK